MPASDASMRRFIDAAEVGASMQTGYRYAVLRFVDHGPGVRLNRARRFSNASTPQTHPCPRKGRYWFGHGHRAIRGQSTSRLYLRHRHRWGGLTFTVVLPIEQIAAPEPKQSTGKTKDAKQKTSWFSSERKTQATQPKREVKPVR